MATPDALIVARMKDVLSEPANHGICGVCGSGKCGLEMGEFGRQVIRAFPGDEQHVGARLLFLQAQPPFVILNNFQDQIAVCYDSENDSGMYAANAFSVGEPAKAPTKTQLVDAIADKTGLTKTDVKKVIDALSDEIQSAVCMSGPGKISLDSLMTIEVDRVSYAPEVIVQIKSLKRLRDMANS